MPPQIPNQTLPTTSLKTSPKDFLLHLATTITLYIAVGSLITLIFAVIDRALPVTASDFYSYRIGYTSSMRFAIASMLILFPLYFIFVWLIEKDIRLVPEKAHLGVRRWLSYITLFGAIALVAGDLIALINYFLNGDLTNRFLLKVLALLIVATIIFWGYLATVRHPSDIVQAQRQIKMASIAGIVVILATLISGFVIVGSPATARKLDRDAQRISNLSNIQNQVQNYWVNNRKLPSSLDTIKDGLYPNIPVDPKSGKAYLYIPIASSTPGALSNSFKLCATFELSSDEPEDDPYAQYAYPMQAYSAYGNGNWKHSAGEVCFDRSINPELYPVKSY